MQNIILSKCVGGFGEKKSNSGTQYYQQNRVYSMGDICLALPAQLPYGSYNYLEIKKVEDIKQLGKLEEGSSQRRIVYDADYSCPTLQAAMGAGGGNVPLVTKVEKLGNIGDANTQSRTVYGSENVGPTLCAGMDHGNTVPFIVENTRLEAVIGSMQENAMVGNGDYSPSLTSAMGMGGGQIPMVVEKSCVAMRGRNPENPSDRTKGIELEQKLEPNSQGLCNTLTSVQKDNLVLEQASLRMVRTEEGKALRKQYEAGEIHHGFNEYREAEPRQDGISNTITTVQKDNLILEKSVVAIDEQNKCIRTETFGTLTTDGSSPKHNNRVGEIKKIKIRQATKQGFIECEIGGGMLFGVPDKHFTTRQNNRERKDKPDNNDGECP